MRAISRAVSCVAASEVVEAARQAVRAALTERDVARLREKGVLPPDVGRS